MLRESSNCSVVWLMPNELDEGITCSAGICPELRTTGAVRCTSRIELAGLLGAARAHERSFRKTAEAGGDDLLARFKAHCDDGLLIVLLAHSDPPHGHGHVALDHVDVGSLWATLHG